MNMEKYKIGDMVQVVGTSTSTACKYIGRFGRIIDKLERHSNCIVELMTGAKVLLPAADLMVLENDGGEEKIVIYRKGDKVIARHYVGKRIVDEAVATCSKDDEFDFNYGASLAAHRLFFDARKNTVLTHYRQEINNVAKDLMNIIAEMRGGL